jgi:hypothetical protein
VRVVKTQLRLFFPTPLHDGSMRLWPIACPALQFFLVKSSCLALHSGKVYDRDMNRLSRFVSLHPYFKVPPDKMPYLKAILPEFVAKTRNETGNLFL